LKEEFITFSNGFLKGFLPRPFFKPYFDDEVNKNVKKISILPKEVVFELVDKFDMGELDINSQTPEAMIVEYLKNAKFEKVKKEEVIIQKNSIDRLTNRTNEKLYSLKEEYIDAEFEIYFKTTLNKNEVEGVFEFLEKRGFGKDKSVGKGRGKWKIEWEFEEKRYFEKKGKYFLNLSIMIKNENDKLIYGKTITKFPKSGGIYAYSKPFKNPFIAFLPGSIFESTNPGKMVEIIDGIYQNGRAVGIYFGEEK
jgi:CRISPR-associated protein Csm4